MSDTSEANKPSNTTTEESASNAGSFRRKLFTRLLVSLLLGVLFAWYLSRAGLDLAPGSSAFVNVRWWTVPAYFALYGVVHYFRAVRWDYLLRPIAHVPTRRIIAIGFVGFFAIMLLPLRMGEVVRPYLVREKGKITGSAAMGTIAAERVLDGFYVALLLALSLLFVPRRELHGVYIGSFNIEQLPRLGYLTVAFFTSALVVLAFFLWQRKIAEKITYTLVGLVSQKLAKRLAEIVGGLADGLRSLPDPKLMGAFTLYSGLYWASNALSMWFLGWGCGLPMTPGQGFAVMGVLAMGILLPAAPGLFGAFQFAVFSALAMYFPLEQVHREGAAYVFLMYLVQLAFHALAGVIPLFTDNISLSRALNASSGPSTPVENNE